MRVLYQSERALVAHASCLEICQALGPRSVHHVITDPPYTEHVHQNIRSCNTTGVVKVREWDPGFAALDSYEHVPAMLSVAQRWVLAFCALEQFDEYRKAAGGHWKKKGCYVRSGIWRKQQAAPQLSGDRPANSCEGIAVMHARKDGAERIGWNGHGKHGYWRAEGEWVGVCSDCCHVTIGDAECPMCRAPVRGTFIPQDELFVEHGRERAEKRHPAQKPESLMSELVTLFTDPDEWILDPYCGSGSTGVAALKAGRRIILADDFIDDNEDESARKPRDYWAAQAAERIAVCEAELQRAA